ncbi:MAG: hypothetical protein LBD23_03145 [Oscillospiraceae bacterium]|jgi:hypothetical protein|nr:hypothetical protein [Oscillospiraceae bacterium]
MKKILLSSAFTLCVLAIGLGIYTYQSVPKISDIVAQNIEALAEQVKELPPAIITCDSTWEGKVKAYCWDNVYNFPWQNPCKWTGMQITYCITPWF